MSGPIHHVPEAMLAACAAGALPYPFALLVAAHATMCDRCRADLEAHGNVGGVVLEGLTSVAVSAETRAAVLHKLASDPSPAPREASAGWVPRPLSILAGKDALRWRLIGFGARQAILWTGEPGSVRLISVPAGQAVPAHSHGGNELTLVISGAFKDESGTFRAGFLLRVLQPIFQV